MPSCSSNSSNITSTINSLNVTQGSGGSRLLISIPYVAGLTTGQVIRYDVPTSGYTGSKADTPAHAEVFGIIESHNIVLNKLNVVMNGSINISDTNLVNLPLDPTGASGGNDIYFLSGTTAGALQNLVPSDINHVIKPIYQRAPHGTYSGSVVNYSGYKMGGDVQATLDTINMLARVGSLQFVFEGVDVESDYDSEVTTFRNTKYYDLEASTPVDWKFEHIRIDDDADFQVFRSIDFPEMTQKVFPMFNSGWIERVKVDTDYQVDDSYIDRSIQQLSHPSYSPAPAQQTWYGIIRYWDSATRYLYIERPAVWNAELKTGLLGNLLAKRTSPLIVNNGSTPDSSGPTIEINATDTAIQFVGYLMPWFRWDGESGGSLGPFSATTRYDPFADNTPEIIGIFSKIFMKVKNRGISVVVPQNITADTITADTITLPTYDLITKIADLESRLDNAGIP